MLEQLNRLIFLEVMKEEIAEYHVILPLERIPDRILLEAGELQTERLSPLASLVECEVTDITSMQDQIDPCPTRPNSQTQGQPWAALFIDACGD